MHEARYFSARSRFRPDEQIVIKAPDIKAASIECLMILGWTIQEISSEEAAKVRDDVLKTEVCMTEEGVMDDGEDTD